MPMMAGQKGTLMDTIKKEAAPEEEVQGQLNEQEFASLLENPTNYILSRTLEIFLFQESPLVRLEALRLLKDLLV